MIVCLEPGRGIDRHAYRDTVCHAPNPGPTRLADPNRFSGRETQDWDSLPDFNFFFFFFKNRTDTCGYGPHLKTESKYYIQIEELPPEWCPSNSRHI